MQFLVTLLGGMLAGDVVDALRSWNVRRRRAAVRRGDVAVAPCHLSVGAARARQGHLVLDPDRVWVAAHGGEKHELRGERDARQVARELIGGRRGTDTVLVHLARRSGPLQLRLLRDDAATLLEVLSGQGDGT